MRLMTHANTLERRQQAIDEARREEREAMAAYKRAVNRNGYGPELYRLVQTWWAARDRLAALEKEEEACTAPLTPWTREQCLRVVQDQIERNVARDVIAGIERTEWWRAERWAA